jgi:hypothetical protein
MKKIIFVSLLLLALTHRPFAQSASFADTLDMITRSWKLVSAEGLQDTSIHLEKQLGNIVLFRKDFTYTTKSGDSTTEQGTWAIDRDKQWLLTMPVEKMVSICKIEKLTAEEWKLSFAINDDKIWLTMIPSEHK